MQPSSACVGVTRPFSASRVSSSLPSTAAVTTRPPAWRAAAIAMKFRSPVYVGDLVTLHATVNAVWRTSMEVGVRVESEDVTTRQTRHTCTAYLTMVALDEHERAMPVAPLTQVTELDRRRHEDACRRREIRLAWSDSSG